jgi:DNA segregation ATPase FtsK/SpoIIIE-like protein
MNCKLPALIGSTLDGKPLCIDIAAMPHLIVGGGTGSGKSTLLSCAILSLCAYRSPDEVRLLLADPKKIEFSAIGAFLPHLLHPIISDCQDVIAALKWLISETERRYDLLSAAGVYLFDAYNKKVKDTERLYRIVFVIDEIADYMITDTEFDDLVMRLSQKARAVGIHLVLSTQRTSHDVLTGAVKANIPARIALSCYSRNDSMNLFDEDGAERLMSNGDMLLRLPAIGSVRAQGAFVSCAGVSAALTDIGKKYKKAEICKELAEYIKETKSTARTDMSDECKERVLEYIEDDTFLKAVDLTLKNRTVTSATLQRWLRIGYSKAVSYLDIMEDMGIIASTSKPSIRTALIGAEEWDDIKGSLLTFKKIGARGSRGEDEDIAPLDSADIPDFSTLFEGLDEDDADEDVSPLDSADLPDFSALLKSLEADDEEDGTDMPTSEPTPNVLNDDLFKLAVNAVFEDGKAVASLLQKRLFIGYIRAFNLIAAMHDFGIIGDMDTPGVYVPIISREEWLDILKKHNIT